MTPVRIIAPARVDRKGSIVATSERAALVFHRVIQPVYRGVFKVDAA